MPTTAFPDIAKIAVLRANAIGDFLFSLPALDALRARYPEAEIVLLGRPWHAGFLAGRPGPVDRTVVVPPSRGVHGDPDVREDPRELERFFSAMRRERFDLAVQLHGGGRYSNGFLLRLGARVTIGARTPDAPALDRSIPYAVQHHEVLRELEVVALAGAEPAGLEPRVVVTDADRRESGAVLAGVEALGGRPLVVLHPGALDPRRRWPPERFAAVGEALAAAGAAVAVTGSDAERPLTAAVAAGVASGAHDLGGRLSLGGLAGLLERSALAVSNDSGPVHLAAAVGTATVGLFWIANFVNGGPVRRARHRPFVSFALHCPTCRAEHRGEGCRHLGAMVADLPVEPVREAALALLEGGTRPAR